MLLVASAAFLLAPQLGRGDSYLAASRPRASSVPRVDVAALHGHGTLAFVAGGTLFVADGSEQVVRRVPTGGSVPFEPELSFDGKWLAFLTNAPGTDGSEEVLWLAHGDGTDAHRVSDLPFVYPTPDAGESPISWSPTADELLVTTGPAPLGFLVPRRVWIVPAGGRPRQLLAPGYVGGAIWSPNGASVAVMYGAKGIDEETVVVPEGGGPAATWYRPSIRQEAMSFAGWYPGVGIVVWFGWYGPATENYGASLGVIAGKGSALHRLARSPIFQPPAVAGAPGGHLALVADLGGTGVGQDEGAKFVWYAKAVETCSLPSASCATVPTPRDDVSLDPAWSPEGTALAYVSAPERTLGVPSGPPRFTPYEYLFTWPQVAPWYDEHTLWILASGSSSPQRVPSARGASDLDWSSSGTSLLYVSHRELWLLPTLTASPVRIAPVDASSGERGRYVFGYADWTGSFTWWSGS